MTDELKQLRRKDNLTVLEKTVLEASQWLRADYAEEAAQELTSLRADNAALRQMLRRLEWYSLDVVGRPSCPLCEGLKPRHFDDCELARLLKET